VLGCVGEDVELVGCFDEDVVVLKGVDEDVEALDTNFFFSSSL